MIRTDPRPAAPRSSGDSTGDRTASSLSDLPLPPGSVLLHIGPHKTGTTSIQFALHHGRPQLARHGVVYAAKGHHAVAAAQAVRGLPPLESHARGMRQWQGIVRLATGASDARVVISSEWYAEATTDAIERIVDDLGADRTHAVVTLRPLAALVPSQWQQYVQGGLTTAYEDWLADVFGDTDSSMSRAFWRRHRHDALIERWARVLGPDRVTAIVVDDRDHGFVLRVFEALVGLPPETLELVSDRSNRSLTWPEIEVLREVNRALLEAGMPGAMRSNLVLHGAARALWQRQPPASEPRIQTPSWAVERAAGIGVEMAAHIAELRVRVVGDLGSLGSTPPARAGSAVTDPGAWAEIAGLTARGVAGWAGLPMEAVAGPRRAPGGQIGTGQMAGILLRRVRRGITRRLRRLVDRQEQVAAGDR